MYLSVLELYGFKSFPNRTKLTFAPGVMAIVGPNGCGKTNIVDAVRWVLGEQRTSVLRSDKMENVIFAGANGKKPAKYAEVTLVIENTNNVLPADYSQVAVTRRLYRDGESEYLINRRPCRLKDIRTLFADTGLGPDSYSIIELSMVEGILSGRPEERRKLFEEAAGVTLYKSRLRTSLTKLSALDSDLNRISDLLSEITTRRNSLKRQVGKAKKYRYLTEALRVKELTAAGNEISELRAKLVPLKTEIDSDASNRTRLEQLTEKEQSALSKLRGSLMATEEEIGVLRQERNRLDSRLQNAQRELVVLEERIRSTENRRKEQDSDEEQLLERHKELTGELEILREKLSLNRREFEDVNGKLAEAKESLDIAEKELSDKRKEKEDKERLFRDSERERLTIENSIQRNRDLSSRSSKRLEELEHETAQLSIPQGTEELEGQVESLEDDVAGVKEEIQNLNRDLAELREQQNDRSQEIAGLQSSLKAAEKRIEFLQRLVVSGEGRPKAVKTLLKSNIKGLVGRLGDLIQPEEGYEQALSAALEGIASTVLMESRHSIQEAVDLLLQPGTGRGSLSLTGVEDSSLPQELPGIPLNDVVTSERPQATASLMSRIRLCPDVSSLLDALPIAREHNLVLVTKEGIRLDGSGVLHAGEMGKSDFGAVNLLKEAEKEKTDVEKKISKLEESLAGIKLHVSDLQAEREKNQQIVSEKERLLQTKRHDLVRLESEIKAFNERSERRERELDRLRDEVEGFKNKIVQLNQEHEKFKDIIEKQDDDLKLSNEALAVADEQTSKLRIDLSQKQQNMITVSSSLERVEGDVQRHEVLLREISGRLSRIKDERILASQSKEDTESRKQTLTAEISLLENNLKEVKNSFSESYKKYDAAKASVAEKEGLLEGHQEELRKVTERLHTGELELKDYNHRVATIRERILEAYEIDLLAHPQENLPLAVEDDNPYMGRSLGDVRSMLRDIGPVNQMALEEYEIVDQRWKHLGEQRDDLVDSRATLDQTIKEINSVARKRFLDTFARVEANFVRLFDQLFGGGEAKLELSDGDPLEAGIKIYATPKGKKLSAIDLLSGGEKALTAISLLFALYLERPSPFCFLDEVDAPLDDRNVIRFINLLREFTERTQFLVVTHNKLSMENSDRLYGVTMAEEGISRLVTVEIQNRDQEEREES